MHMAPTIGIWGGHYVYANDIKLPYCGHFQFISSYSTQGQNAAYQENTVDNRQVGDCCCSAYLVFCYICRLKPRL